MLCILRYIEGKSRFLAGPFISGRLVPGNHFLSGRHLALQAIKGLSQVPGNEGGLTYGIQAEIIIPHKKNTLSWKIWQKREIMLLPYSPMFGNSSIRLKRGPHIKAHIHQ